MLAKSKLFLMILCDHEHGDIQNNPKFVFIA